MNSCYSKMSSIQSMSGKIDLNNLHGRLKLFGENLELLRLCKKNFLIFVYFMMFKMGLLIGGKPVTMKAP